MKKYLLIIAFIFIIILAACSPAQTISGTYNGTYIASNFIVNSGNGTILLNSNDPKTVDMVFKSTGNPDFIINSIKVSKKNADGVIYLLEAPGNPFSFIGTVEESTWEIDIFYSDNMGKDMQFIGDK